LPIFSVPDSILSGRARDILRLGGILISRPYGQYVTGYSGSGNANSKEVVSVSWFN
jgi:hypothetical protein